jgi:hypothetical protein
LGRSEGLAEGGELDRVALRCPVCDGERPAEGSGCRQEIDDFFDRFVGAVIGEFEVAVWPVLRIRPVVKAAVGERTTQALVEEQQEQCDLNAFSGEAVSVAGAVTFEEAVCLEFAQVVTKLVEAVGVCREIERGEDGVVDLSCRPATDLGAGVQENLEQADDPGVLDFNAGVADRADGNGQGDALQQGKVGVDVEPLGLESGKPADDGLEPVADLIQMIQSLLETEVVEVVGTEFVAQEHRELLILPENGIAEVGAEHVVAVLDLIDEGEELAAVVAPQARAEYLGYFVGGQSPQAKLTASLEQLVDGKVALEDKIEAVLDLTDRIAA